MNNSDSANYEKQFLIKYFTKQATVKIDKLKEKISDITSKSEIIDIHNKIKNIETDLQNTLKIIDEDTTSNVVESTEKINTIKVSNEIITYKGINTPKYIWDYLFNYQQDGVKWMIDLHIMVKGGLLADEMGLGKTMQAIAFIFGIFEMNSHAKILIICPATVIDQWINEIKKFHPKFNVSTKMINSGCIVMGYEKYKSLESKQSFDSVILDEGHRIKNKDAQITKCVKKIRCNSRFILTGTPIQNNLTELWSIFDFIVPGLLGTHLVFEEEFSDKIKDKSDSDASYRYSVMLRSTIEPYILRRMKSQIAYKLPGKIDKVVFVTFTPIQHKMYIKALESNKMRKAMVEKMGLLGVIDHLRKICNHPALLTGIKYNEQGNDDDNNSIENDNNLNNSIENDNSEDDSCNYEHIQQTGNSLIDSSCKMIATMSFLKKWKKEGKKVLIFTQTVQMQKIIEQCICKYNYMKMSGSTPTAKRNQIVQKFNEDKNIFIFLLTTKVGGLGLNLTGANRIILYDPDWNPSTDNQAKERIYRYGQKSDVEIYRLICKETIEERVYQKQIYKNCLSKKILSDPRTVMSKEAMIDLFSYYGSEQAAPKIEDFRNIEIEQDKLVEINDEDNREYSNMKEYNSREYLNGEELIEYIMRRESNLNG